MKVVEAYPPWRTQYTWMCLWTRRVLAGTSSVAMHPAAAGMCSRLHRNFIDCGLLRADRKLQERQIEEQRRLMAALHSRNCMLNALNNNLLMQLNLLRSLAPVERIETRSLHLRIALPGSPAPLVQRKSVEL